jgi:hypothetical protein
MNFETLSNPPNLEELSGQGQVSTRAAAEADADVFSFLVVHRTTGLTTAGDIFVKTVEPRKLFAQQWQV